MNRRIYVGSSSCKRRQKVCIINNAYRSALSISSLVNLRKRLSTRMYCLEGHSHYTSICKHGTDGINSCFGRRPSLLLEALSDLILNF